MHRATAQKMSPDLLKILICPVTRQPLALAAAALVDQLNAGVARGEVRNVGGRVVTDKLDAGLARQDGAVIYPVRGGIPVLLAEEGIPVSATPRA